MSREALTTVPSIASVADDTTMPLTASSCDTEITGRFEVVHAVAGAVITSIGAPVSIVAKVKAEGAVCALPAASIAPSTTTTYNALSGSADAGVKVAIVADANATVPATGTPSEVTRISEPRSTPADSGSSKVTVI